MPRASPAGTNVTTGVTFTKCPTKSKQYFPPLPKQHTLHKFLSLPAPSPITASEEYDTWGHTMDDIYTSSTFRIVLQNPNGIKPSLTDLEFQYGLSKCCSLGVRVLSIPETKLNWTTSASNITYKWFHQTWQFSSLSYSQTQEEFISYHQPGGTLTAVVDRWTSRVQLKGQDPFWLGLWSYITLQGKQDFILTLPRKCRQTSPTT